MQCRAKNKSKHNQTEKQKNEKQKLQTLKLAIALFCTKTLVNESEIWMKLPQGEAVANTSGYWMLLYIYACV